MQIMTRRALLRSTALVPIAALAACNGMSAAQIGQQVAGDVSLLGTGLAGALPGLVSLKVLTGADVSKVSGLVGQLTQLASGVSSALTQTAAQPVIQQIGGVLAQIAAVAGPLLPPPWGTAIMAAQVLFPVIASAVGLISQAAPLAGPMTPDQARAALRAAAAR